MGKIWEIWVSLLQLSQSVYIIILGCYFFYYDVFGTCLTEEVKGRNMFPSCSFGTSTFQWIVSQICAWFILYKGANAPAHLPAKHLVFFVFLSFQDCMCPGVEWGWLLVSISCLAVVSIAYISAWLDIFRLYLYHMRRFFCCPDTLTFKVITDWKQCCL